jgi:uncharacterized protein
MRKYLFLFLAIAALPWNAARSADIPEPQGRVSDFATVLSAGEKEKLSALCEEVERRTGAEIAVVTQGSIAPLDEQEYCRLIFDKWSPGKKGKDNGVLFFLAVTERRWRIETGYGMEEVLPDGLCGQIGRDYMVPLFKRGAYGEGLLNGVKAAAAGIYRHAGLQPGEKPVRPGPPDVLIFAIIMVAFVIFLVLLMVLRYRLGGYLPGSGGYYGNDYYGGSRGRNGWSGGGSFGGFGGGKGGGGGAGGGF